MIRFAFSILTAFAAVSLAYVFYPFHLISGKKKGYNWIIKPFFKLILKIGGVKVDISGIENIDTGKNYLIVANHQSVFDIITICATLPLDIRILAKKEMLLIPLFGWILPLYDYVMVNRKNRRDSVKSINKAVKILRHKSLLIFPEGTRSSDGTVGKFKSGGISTAYDAQVEILPVALTNVFNIMRKNELSIHSGTVGIKILEPIEIKDKLKRKDIASLIENKIRTLVEPGKNI